MPSSPVVPTERDADYDAAIATVRHAIDAFSGCSVEERATLQHDLEQLHDMVEKLEAGRVEIVVFGEISTGKSALINALVGDAVAQVNVRGGWTKDVWHVPWSGAGYCLPGLASSELVLIDTPGLNEVDGAARAKWPAKRRSGPTWCCSSPIRISTKSSFRHWWSSPLATSRLCWS